MLPTENKEIIIIIQNFQERSSKIFHVIQKAVFFQRLGIYFHSPDKFPYLYFRLMEPDSPNGALEALNKVC